MSKHKITINFEIEDGQLKNCTSFENNPTVHNVINALDSTLGAFKKAVIEKVEREGINDDEFENYIKELNVNDLSD